MRRTSLRTGALLLWAPLALASLVAGGSADAAAPAAHTQVVVLRPVHANGTPVAGWTVHRQRGSVFCSGAAPSAVSRNIVECYPTADYLPACWKSGHHTVLCLRGPRKTLVRMRYQGTIDQVRRPQHVAPLDMVLSHGQPCDLRIGGAWGYLPSHPNWVGFYSCANGAVYGPPSGTGVNHAHQPWTVHLWLFGTKDRVVTRSVRTAYLVGTAR